VNIIKDIGFAPSNSEARRLIQQGGVSLNGETISDVHTEITFNDDSELIIKVGKRKFGKLIS
jgi:tyrosyl-tRNA synthetase